MITLFIYLFLGSALYYGLYLFSKIFPNSIRVYIVYALLNHTLLYCVVGIILYTIIDGHFNPIYCDSTEVVVTIKGVEITGLTWIASQFGNGAALSLELK